MVTKTTFLNFRGLDAPAAIESAAGLLPLITSIFAKWPHVLDTTSDKAPFLTIRPHHKKGWELILEGTHASPRYWDAVNAVCDLVAETAWERIRTDPTLLCLHAAAVDFGGRLVVLPNARRAGKSTLAAALGHLGYEIYSDDVLPIRISTDIAPFQGIANGVAPRVRLPLPGSFAPEIRDWVGQDKGPSNKQYKYLLNCPTASEGETMPLGAIVILDRKVSPCEVSLDPIPSAVALSSLISQNFARTLHAGTILRSIEAIVAALPAYRLTYDCAETAAQFLSSHPSLKGLPAAKYENATPENGRATLEWPNYASPVFNASTYYVQSKGVTVCEAGDAYFLADGDGRSIFQLNAISAAIWTLLKDPTNHLEVSETLSAAFEDADPAQVSADCDRLMQNLAATNLIVPAPVSMAAT